MSTTPLRTALNTFHSQLDQRQQMRRVQRIQKGKAEQEMPRDSLISFTLSPDVRAYFDMVMQSVMQDRRRYWPASALHAPAAPPAFATSDADTHASAMPAPLPPAAQEPVPSNALIPQQIAAASIFLNLSTETWLRNERLLPASATGPQMSTSVRFCLDFMLFEFNQLNEEVVARGNLSNVLLNKLKQAIQAYHEGRTMDTATLLKNALSSDPHNHTLLAILSQVLYQLAASGQQTALPEARENAQRSIIFSEKLKPKRLAIYRYLAMVTEREFGPERTLEWLRDTGILNTHEMQSKEGLLAMQGIYLRGWALLATIPPSLWSDNEFNALHTLVNSVIGGGAVYMAWFRGPLLQFAAAQKTPPSVISDIERLVQTSYMFYEETARGMRQLPMQKSSHPWFLRVRFLNTVAQVCPLPQFDQALFMISLDGRGWKEDVFPDMELRALLNDVTMNYWKLWALVITPHRDVRQPYLLPAEETVNDNPLLETCDKMLTALKEAETERIKPAVWEDLKPWMVRWQIDHLLAAGSGSNKPRSRFSPNLVPYTHFYRNWQDPIPVGILASDIITENAKRGAFASLFEIAAAFEGALRIIDDPVHGLIPSQKRALQAARQQNPKKFASVSVDFGSAVTGGKVMMGLLPLGMLGGIVAIIQLSANWSQAIGLMLALAGLAGVVVINLSKK